MEVLKVYIYIDTAPETSAAVIAANKIKSRYK